MSRIDGARSHGGGHEATMPAARAPGPHDTPRARRHSLLDDAQALFTGTAFIAFAVAMYSHAGLLSGGTAGLAFLAHYLLDVPFGAAFFVLNLPFYWLAWRRLGRRFTAKTLVAVSLLSGLVELQSRWVSFQG